MVDSNRKDFRYKSEWRKAKEQKEFEKYSIHDGGQFLITGLAIAFLIVATKALQFPVGSGEIPNLLLYFLGLPVLMAVNALGIMIQKKGHLIGALVEKITYGGLFALAFYTFNYLNI